MRLSNCLLCLVLFVVIPIEIALPQDSAQEALESDMILHFTAADSSSLEQVKALNKDGRFAEAEALARELLVATASRHGEESLEVAAVLDVLGESLWYGGKAEDPEAAHLAERALRIKENLLDPEHREVASSLNRVGMLYARQGRYAEAVPLSRRALELREKAAGPEDLSVAQVMHNVALLYWYQGKYPEADTLCRRALAIREKVLGPEHEEVADGLNNLGILCMEQGKYAEAIPLYQRAQAIWEKIHGPDHEDVAKCLTNLAIVLRKQGKPDEAEPLYVRALEIRKKVYGDQHPEVSAALMNLANLYQMKGQYPEAEQLQKQALHMNEKLLGPDHQRVAVSLGNLAHLYHIMGRLDEVEQMFQRVIDIYKRSLGSDHPELATWLQNLAFLYQTEGRYADAEPLYEQVLAIREKTLGPDHPEVARALEGLASLCRVTGRYDEAEQLQIRGLRIWEQAFGRDHSDVAFSLGNLADLRVLQGRYYEADTLSQRTVAIAENVLGPEHPDVAPYLNSMADLYVKQGRLDEAGLHYERALAIVERAHAADHPAIGHAMIRLAALLTRQSEFDDAKSFFDKALIILEKSLGPEHPDLADALVALSDYYRAREDADQAIRTAERAIDIRRLHFDSNAPVLAEKDAVSFSQSLRESVDNYLSCFVSYGPTDSEAVRSASDVILSNKGHVSDGIFERRGKLVRLLADAESLRLAKYQLSQLYVEGAGDDPSEYRAKLDSLTSLADNLESDLARSSENYRIRQDYKNVSAERIAWLLPYNSVLVEFLRYDYRSLDPDTTVPHYMVMVLDADVKPLIVDLGSSSEIDRLIDQYREHLLGISRSGREPTFPDVEDYEDIATALFERVWQPFADYASGKQLVFIAPDGGLNMLSFAALPVGENQYLIEKTSIHYLSSGRDLIRLKDRSGSADGLFALGDPDYNAAVEERLLEISSPEGMDQTPAVYSSVRNIRSGCTRLEELAVEPLPGTRSEIERIAENWNATSTEKAAIYLGSAASEEVFKAESPGKRIVHLATHGYFFESSCMPSLPTSRFGPDRSYEIENPLLLSGLLLAGANLHGDGCDKEGAEDGILTACEVSEMVLDGTDLVVLSACETGLGEVEDGEGVYGLRRAFQMAGARTVISALWPVSDELTADIMSKLYDIGVEVLPERIRKTQMDKLGELRATGKSDHPFNWAGFIALGDWR